jgi:hypothetical protein
MDSFANSLDEFRGLSGLEQLRLTIERGKRPGMAVSLGLP